MFYCNWKQEDYKSENLQILIGTKAKLRKFGHIYLLPEMHYLKSYLNMVI